MRIKPDTWAVYADIPAIEAPPELVLESTKWRPETSLGYYHVENVDIFISEIKKLYAASGSELHEVVERRIRNHLASNNNILPRMAGIAGLHAEVQALNHIISMTDTEARVASKLCTGFNYDEHRFYSSLPFILYD
ncbi:hypothetical protein B6N85_000125 [Salmonella enterica subsp. diarizonae serovar 61:l,v:1,5,7]|nr:hypothetical protein [Salmonella enterica subsp. diarizonae serovar 61:l,v:1,5,7]